MSKSTIGVQAAFAELPFLKEYAREEGTQYVKIECVDPSLLQRKPGLYEWVWFVSEDGQRLLDLAVGFFRKKRPWWLPKWIFSSLFWSNTGRNFNETIGDALRKLDECSKGRVFYILCITGAHIWIYKPPKQFTLVRWIEQKIAAERRRFRYGLEEDGGEAPDNTPVA